MPKTVGADPSPDRRRAAELTALPDEEFVAVVTESLASRRTDLALRDQARRAVLDVEMLTSAAVAQALGMRGSQREAASRRRRTGALLGVLDGGSRGYLYPAFQVDPVAQRVRPVVATVNRALDATGDPWGVASWWVSPTPRLDGSSPASLVGSDIEDDLLVLVGAAPAGTASDARAALASPG